MDFNLSRSQIEIQKAVTDFARGELTKERAEDFDEKRVFPAAIFQQAADLGFIGIHLDEAYAGGGLGPFENVLVSEALCRKDSTIGSAVMLAAHGCECLLRFGSGELKEDYLPLIAAGKMLSGLACSEYGIYQGMAAITTTAVKEKDSWRINGIKRGVINGGSAGLYGVLCRTRPEEKGSDGLSLILVEGDRDGVVVCDTGEKIGLRATSIHDMVFENVQVPLSNLIGKENAGARQMESVLSESRLLMASIALGIGQGAMDRAVAYIRQREQFGRKIAEFQVTKHKVAEMAVQVAAARFVTYQAARQHNPKKPDHALTAMARLTATRAALHVSHEAIQLLGGYGYTRDYEVERFCRDAKCLEMISEIPGMLKDAIGDGFIGKIRQGAGPGEN